MGFHLKATKHLDRNILTNRPKFSRVSKTAVYWLDDAIKPNGWSFQSSDGESRASDLLWHGSYGHSKCFTLGLRAKLCHPLCKGFVLMPIASTVSHSPTDMCRSGKVWFGRSRAAIFTTTSSILQIVPSSHPIISSPAITQLAAIQYQSNFVNK